MNFTHIDQKHLDAVWPAVSSMLDEAIQAGCGESDISQLRAKIAFGGAHLLVIDDGKSVVSVAVLSFTQYANYRAAHIEYMAGHAEADMLEEVKGWARAHGASKIQCLCDEPRARLFGRVGLSKVYNMMRADL